MSNVIHNGRPIPRYIRNNTHRDLRYCIKSNQIESNHYQMNFDGIGTSKVLPIGEGEVKVYSRAKTPDTRSYIRRVVCKEHRPRVYYIIRWINYCVRNKIIPRHPTIAAHLQEYHGINRSNERSFDALIDRIYNSIFAPVRGIYIQRTREPGVTNKWMKEFSTSTQKVIRSNTISSSVTDGRSSLKKTFIRADYKLHGTIPIGQRWNGPGQVLPLKSQVNQEKVSPFVLKSSKQGSPQVLPSRRGFGQGRAREEALTLKTPGVVDNVSKKFTNFSVSRWNDKNSKVVPKKSIGWNTKEDESMGGSKNKSFGWGTLTKSRKSSSFSITDITMEDDSKGLTYKSSLVAGLEENCTYKSTWVNNDEYTHNSFSSTTEENKESSTFQFSSYSVKEDAKKGSTYKASSSPVKETLNTEDKQGSTYKSSSSPVKESVKTPNQGSTYKSSSSSVQESVKTAKKGSKFKLSSSNVEESNDINKGCTYKSTAGSSIISSSSTSKQKGVTFKNKFHYQANLLQCWFEEEQLPMSLRAGNSLNYEHVLLSRKDECIKIALEYSLKELQRLEKEKKEDYLRMKEAEAEDSDSDFSHYNSDKDEDGYVRTYLSEVTLKKVLGTLLEEFLPWDIGFQNQVYRMNCDLKGCTLSPNYLKGLTSASFCPCQRINKVLWKELGILYYFEDDYAKDCRRNSFTDIKAMLNHFANEFNQNRCFIHYGLYIYIFRKCILISFSNLRQRRRKR